MLNFHKIKIEYWKVIERDSFRRARRDKERILRQPKQAFFFFFPGDATFFRAWRGQGGQSALSAS